MERMVPQGMAFASALEKDFPLPFQKGDGEYEILVYGRAE
jgi:hypothetical protein